VDAEVDKDTEMKMETKMEMETNTEMETDAEMEMETETKTETNTGTCTKSEAKIEIKTEIVDTKSLRTYFNINLLPHLLSHLLDLTQSSLQLIC
jgi:hypothetical protein